MTTLLQGSFTAAGQSASASVRKGRFNYSVWAVGDVGVATLALERSFDGGDTWWPESFNDGALAQWTAPAGSYGEEVEGRDNEPTLYRFNCTSHTSGTIRYRLGQAED